MLDAFVRDTTRNTTTLVSLSDPDVQSGGNDQAMGITDDGNQVLFGPDAATLTTNPAADPDTNLDLFVRNISEVRPRSSACRAMR